MPDTAAGQLSGFLAKFDPRVARLIRDCRRALRHRFPTAYELVYDNYNFFVIGYCTTKRPSDCVVSLAANRKGVNLNFYRGATLPDPHKLLKGSGNQNRFIRVDAATVLTTPEIEQLLTAAAAQADAPFAPSGAGQLIVRSISEKQQPRK